MSSRFEHLLQALLNGESLDDFKPLSRIEECLINCCRRIGRDGLPEPHSRAEFLLQELADQLASGDTGGIIPTGSITITENGEYDVTRKAKAIVDVEGDEPIIVPLEITENGTYTAQEGIDGYSPVMVNVEGDEPVIVPLEITENGTYTAQEGIDGYSPITVNVEGSSGGDDLVKQIIERTATEISSDTVEHVGDSAFYKYTNLRNVNFPNLKSIGTDAFYGCTYLAIPSLPSGLTSIGNHAFNSCQVLAITSIPSGVTSIGANAFTNCSNLRSITFEGTPTSIYATSFNACYQLKTINVPWAEGEVANAPWGATSATINYNYTGG